MSYYPRDAAVKSSTAATRGKHGQREVSHLPLQLFSVGNSAKTRATDTALGQHQGQVSVVTSVRHGCWGLPVWPERTAGPRTGSRRESTGVSPGLQPWACKCLKLHPHWLLKRHFCVVRPQPCVTKPGASGFQMRRTS